MWGNESASSANVAPLGHSGFPIPMRGDEPTCAQDAELMRVQLACHRRPWRVPRLAAGQVAIQLTGQVRLRYQRQGLGHRSQSTAIAGVSESAKRCPRTIGCAIDLTALEERNGDHQREAPRCGSGGARCSATVLWRAWPITYSNAFPADDLETGRRTFLELVARLPHGGRGHGRTAYPRLSSGTIETAAIDLTMRLTVDASVALKWLVDDEHSVAAKPDRGTKRVAHSPPVRVGGHQRPVAQVTP